MVGPLLLLLHTLGLVRVSGQPSSCITNHFSRCMVEKTEKGVRIPLRKVIHTFVTFFVLQDFYFMKNKKMTLNSSVVNQ